MEIICPCKACRTVEENHRITVLENILVCGVVTWFSVAMICLGLMIVMT